MTEEGPAPSASTDLPDRTAWLALLLLGSCSATSFLGRLSVNLLVDPIRASLKIDDVQFSFIQGMGYTAPFVIAALVYGWLADRRSGRSLLASGMALWGIGSLGCACSQSFPALLVSRSLIGIGEAAIFPVAMRLITLNFPAAARGRAIGFFFIVVGIGPGVGAAVAALIFDASQPAGRLAPLLHGIDPWRTVFIAGQVPALAGILLIPLIREPFHAKASVVQDGGLRKKFGRLDRPVLLGLICSALILVNLLDLSTLAWVPALLNRDYGFAITAAGSIFGGIAIGAGLGGPLLGGWIADRAFSIAGSIGRLKVCALACLILAGLFVALLKPYGSFTLIALGGISLMICSLGAIGMVVIQETLPEDVRGLGTGMVYSVSALVGGFGPTLVASVNRGNIVVLGTALAAVCVPLALLAASLMFAAIYLERLKR